MAEFDISKVRGNDRFIAGGAVLLLVLAFFPWRTITAGPYKKSYGVFGDYAYGWPKLALLLALAAGAVVIARLMGALDNVQLPAGVNLITLALAGLATLLLVLQFVFGFKSAGFGIDAHARPGFGYYLGLLVSGAMTYFAYLNFKASGEEMPTLPQSGSTPPPPAP